MIAKRVNNNQMQAFHRDKILVSFNAWPLDLKANASSDELRILLITCCELLLYITDQYEVLMQTSVKEHKLNIIEWPTI